MVERPGLEHYPLLRGGVCDLCILAGEKEINGLFDILDVHSCRLIIYVFRNFA